MNADLFKQERGVIAQEYQAIRLIDCARCGERAFENLPTIGHCTSCNYSPEADDAEWNDVAAIPLWALEEKMQMNEAQQIVFSDPEAAIGSPEAARVVIQLVKRSKQALRRAIIRAAAVVAQFGRYLDAKWDEASEIEKKRVIEINERLRNDPCRAIGVRGLL